MTNAAEPSPAYADSVVPFRARGRGRRLSAIVSGRPVEGRAVETTGVVRALTAALAPHLSSADPELHGLAVMLLSAQQVYAASLSATEDDERQRVREQYRDAAANYCAAMERRGLAAPPGLIEAARWLSEPEPTDSP